MPKSDLRIALGLLRLEPLRIARAVAAGVATLGSALALAALSAWLITRAWQMPPVLDLSVAVVAVRALGISRGVFRYLERLATHDAALRGTTEARTLLYEQLSTGDPDTVTSLRRGDLMARTGQDVDVLGDVVVRAIVPICVGAVMGVAAVGLLCFISPAAAAIAALALVLAGVVAPILAARAAKTAETAGADATARFGEAAVRALDHAAELRISGRLQATLDEARSANEDSIRARDRAATPIAFADASLPLSIGASVIGSLLVGIALFGRDGGTAGAISPMALAVLVLVPLAAFEASAALPAAAIALVRAQVAAGRIVPLLRGVPRNPAGEAPPAPHVRVQGRTAIVGPSGSGKTTMLRSIAAEEGPDAIFYAEDAHLFDTSILENLRVSRGDVDEQEAHSALALVGLSAWIEELPDGVDTRLLGGAAAVSGGQRRRLLLARALLGTARTVLLDEPTEHLDRESSDDILRALLRRENGLFGSERTVVVVTHQLPLDTDADLVIDLGNSDAKNTLPTSSFARTL